MEDGAEAVRERREANGCFAGKEALILSSMRYEFVTFVTERAEFCLFVNSLSPIKTIKYRVINLM